jgi:hypothetical protein
MFYNFLIHLVGTALANNISVNNKVLKLEGEKKMVAVIIGTHERFSEKILSSAEMIFGKQENVVAIPFETGESANENCFSKN